MSGLKALCLFLSVIIERDSVVQSARYKGEKLSFGALTLIVIVGAVIACAVWSPKHLVPAVGLRHEASWCHRTLGADEWIRRGETALHATALIGLCLAGSENAEVVLTSKQSRSKVD